MPKQTDTESDGITRRTANRYQTAGMTREEWADLRAELQGLARVNNFQTLAEDLENWYRDDLPPDGATVPYGSRAWYARKIFAQIASVREALADGRTNLALACAYGVGRYHAECWAKHAWPIIEHGRTLKREKRVAGRKRGRAVTREAQSLGESIRRAAAQHDPDEHGPRTAWLMERFKVSDRTIRRHLKHPTGQ